VAHVDPAGTLSDWGLRFADPGVDELSRIPERWRAVATAAQPRERREAALGLWNQGFLDLVPRFAEVLRTRLLDVRAYLADDHPVLVYVVASDGGGPVSWVGFDPGTFGEPPPFWDSFPEPLRVFLRDVHAGYVSSGDAGFGPLPPAQMQTLATLAGFPDGIPGWDEEAGIDSTRLVLVASDGGLLRLCLSPDLPPGQLALVYEGDVDPQDFGAELDQLMMSRLR
jgi:hypothetical protein